MRKLLLAMGSDILMDDAVSIMLSGDLKRSFPEFEMQVQPAGGLELIELLSQFDLVIIIDTFMSTDAEPGRIILFNGFDNAATIHLQNPHDTGFLDSLKLATQLDYPVPEKIVVLGIGIRQQMMASNELSHPMKKSYRNLLNESMEIVESLVQPNTE